jgi:SAM-dependent methyltransferase
VSAAAFDQLAARYDELWTDSITGRAQRQAVWRAIAGLFRSGERVADLGCGTGEDALWLARTGVTVYAVDSSPMMLRIAAERARHEMLDHRILCATADLARFVPPGELDGAISNFGALNTIANLRPLARALASAMRPGGRAALCVMGRFCFWETVWYLLRGQPSKAFRRARGNSRASIGIPVYYHSARAVARSMAPEFRLVAKRGIGIFVPPSSMETVVRRAPGLCAALAQADGVAQAWPLLRSAGDHELLVFARN